MSTLEHAASDYLLNALWQAPLLAAVGWLVARTLRRLGPVAEHRVWVGTLFAQCIVPACAAPGAMEKLRHLLSRSKSGEGVITITLGLVTPRGASAAAPLIHTLVLASAAVTAALLLWLLWQCAQLQRIARAATPLLPGSRKEAVFQELCAQFHLKRVYLAVADTVRTPVTFGWWRPVLLLPPGFVERVSPAQLQVVLSHELAHVARRDFARHLLYRTTALPLAYHPAAWFTLSRIAETRERVCDEMAANQIGSTRQYAHALLELASLLTVQRPAQSHAIGLFDAHQFERRVLMLNRRDLPMGRSLRVALIAGSVMVGAAACTSAVALHLETPFVRSGTAAAANQPVRISPGVAASQVVTKVAPVYPPEAKAAKIQGSVVLSAIIGKSGAVEDLQVVSGPEELRGSALDAVRQWVYRPFLLNGQPVDVETTVTVTYSLGE